MTLPTDHTRRAIVYRLDQMWETLSAEMQRLRDQPDYEPRNAALLKARHRFERAVARVFELDLSDALDPKNFSPVQVLVARTDQTWSTRVLYAPHRIVHACDRQAFENWVWNEGLRAEQAYATTTAVHVMSWHPKEENVAEIFLRERADGKWSRMVRARAQPGTVGEAFFRAWDNGERHDSFISEELGPVDMFSRYDVETWLPKMKRDDQLEEVEQLKPLLEMTK